MFILSKTSEKQFYIYGLVLHALFFNLKIYLAYSQQSDYSHDITYSNQTTLLHFLIESTV